MGNQAFLSKVSSTYHCRQYQSQGWVPQQDQACGIVSMPQNAQQEQS